MKEYYTLNDFIENKCILLNDSTDEDLERVLIAAFGFVKFGFNHDKEKLFFISYGRENGLLTVH